MYSFTSTKSKRIDYLNTYKVNGFIRFYAKYI